MAHQEECEIERVAADVDQRAAALLVLLGKDPPPRDSSPAESMDTGVVDLAHIAGLDEPLEGAHSRVPAPAVGDHQLLSGFLCSLYHRRTLFGVPGDRLLDDDMLAGVQGLHRRV